MLKIFLKENIEKTKTYNSTELIIQTNKIIKIIWKNIYSINQYKENVQTEKLRNIKNP